MNKTIIAGVISFVMGAGVGVGSTYLYFKRRNLKLEQQMEDEIAELRESYRERLNELNDEHVSEMLAGDYSKTSDNEEYVRPEFDPDEVDAECDEDITSYTKCFKGEDTKKSVKEGDNMKDDEKYEVVENDDSAAEDLANEHRPDQKPYIISFDEFGSRSDQETEELFWYMGDETLATEDDEMIESPHDILGDCVDDWLYNEDCDGTICVRNLSRGVDYQIEKVYGRYEDQVN